MKIIKIVLYLGLLGYSTFLTFFSNKVEYTQSHIILLGVIIGVLTLINLYYELITIE